MSDKQPIDPIDPEGLLDEPDLRVAADPGDWAQAQEEEEIMDEELAEEQFERAKAAGDDDEPMDGDLGDAGW